MSWSISKIGFPAVVAAQVAESAKNSKCMEPEETVKNNVALAIVHALEAYPADMAVRVEASGSQGSNNNGVVNSLSVKIEPIYGFLK